MLTTGFFVVAEVTRDSIKYLNFDSSTHEPYASESLSSTFSRPEAEWVVTLAKNMDIMDKPIMYELSLVRT